MATITKVFLQISSQTTTMIMKVNNFKKLIEHWKNIHFVSQGMTPKTYCRANKRRNHFQMPLLSLTLFFLCNLLLEFVDFLFLRLISLPSRLLSSVVNYYYPICHLYAIKEIESKDHFTFKCPISYKI